MYHVPHFIAGKKITGGDEQLDLYNPAEGKVSGTVTVADKQIVDEAVAAALAQFPGWSQTTPVQRAKLLFRYKMLLDKHAHELAELVTKEHGKTLSESLGSLQRGIDVLEFACGIPNLLKGNFAANVASSVDSYSLHQPLGVCVGITPFNFPAMIPLWMFPLAIACGNTFVLKPSEKDPSCSLRLVELAEEAGIPAGVINIVQGNKTTVDALLTHRDVKAVSFVGSSAVAEYVHKIATSHNKRVQAFGGAKNHCLVMPDADMEATVEAIITSAYGCAGERCMALSVAVVVGDETADLLIEKFKARIKKIIVGSGIDKACEMGPLVTQQHLDKVKSYIELGKQEGAQLVVDGSNDTPKNSQGFFMGCCLFDKVTPKMRIYQDEIFGPVLCIVRVADFAAGIKLINDCEYGNGTAIFTRDGYSARTFAEKIQVGMVGINVPVPVPVAYHSFGGWKRSIFSDIGMYGADAIRFYTKLKTVTARWYEGA